MIFRRPSNHYGISPVPVTPHQRAAQVWDDRIGSARVQAKNWRLAFFGALLLSGGLASALVWQSVRGTITPRVVEVDKLGEARAVAERKSAVGGKSGAVSVDSGGRRYIKKKT